MKLIEPSEESYVVWINKEDFTAFDLFYTNAGYRTIVGSPLKTFKNHYGYFIVDKVSKTIGFLKTLAYSTYESKEYCIDDLIVH